MSGNDPQGLDLARLHAYLDEARPGLVAGPLEAELIHGGHSNLSYRVTDGVHRWVARRPPLGHVLPTAHNMAREFQVITALGPTAVPVPRTEVLCEDLDVLGVPFYLMDEVPGTVYRSAAQTARLGPERAAALAYALVDVLAELHDLDPAAVGLAGFGRPEGYLDRQLRRWYAQLDASRSREVPGIDELHARLVANVPAGPEAAIVHGDYRLDNALVGPGDEIVAVLDWEMATLGDPLADLGVMLVYWDWQATMPASGVSDAIRPEAGFPTGEQMCRRYASRRGVDLHELPWYHAFGCFKVAVILEGIHYRHAAGQTLGPGFERIGDHVAPLVDLGHRALERTTAR